VNWRNLDQLHAAIRAGFGQLREHKPELVIGIPRSGMLAATPIALYLDLPLTDVGTFGEHGSAWRRNREFLGSEPKRVLLVDDSTNSGRAMTSAVKYLKARKPQLKIVRVAVFGKPWSIEQKKVDVAFEILDGPRVFEWNFWRNEKIEGFGFDIDGVLCRDPRKDENDDGPRYEEFIRTVPPLFLPKRPIGWLATSRLEKFREGTEYWLAKHGVTYKQLHMLNLPSKADRLEQKPTVGFKAGIFAKSDARLYVESDVKKAGPIARASGKPVLCIENMQVALP